MVDPVQIAVSLPLFYFGLAGHLLWEGWMIAIQVVGFVCLLAGALLAIRGRRKDALLFLIPFVVSEAFVAISAMLGRNAADGIANTVTLTFLAVQLALAVGLVWLLERMRVAAALLAVFSLSYAAFAGLAGVIIMAG